MTERYVYAEDQWGEHFVGEFQTRAAAREAAIEHARANGRAKIVTARALPCDTLSYLPAPDDILDLMHQGAYGEVGEWADDWPDVSKSGMDALTNLLQDWADRYVDTPKFFVVDDVQEEPLP